MARRLLIALVIALLWVAPAAAKATPQDLTLTMSDGTPLACTFWQPDAPGTTRAPAVMLFHGLGGKRQDMAPFADALGAAGYASLACDARGHGASGGLFGLDGPRDVQDTRELFDWLAAQPGVDAGAIGALGVSLGGGAVWNAAAAGVPFRAIVPIITWTKLTDALAPQGLAKSGLVELLASLVPDSRWDPALLAARPALLTSRDDGTVAALAGARSVAPALPRLATPTLLVQGRHDFLFDIDQALTAYRSLAGPKRLYLGNFGHAPDSTTSAPDLPFIVSLSTQWFDRFLRGMPNGVDRGSAVQLGHDPYDGSTTYRGVPPTRRLAFALRGRKTIAQGGKVVRSLRLRTPVETFGDTVVSVQASTMTGWDHLVAVLSSGGTVISEGGTTTRALGAKPRTIRIRLMDESVHLARGARLTLTLAGTSLAQSQSNPLYIGDVSAGSSLTVGKVALSLSALKRPVSR